MPRIWYLAIRDTYLENDVTRTGVAPVIPIDEAEFRVRASKATSAITSVGVSKKRVESHTSFTEDLGFRASRMGGGELASLTSARLSQSELYPVRHAYSREHITALRLLRLACARMNRAMAALASEDGIAADIEVQKVQRALPELFCCRALSDGFGSMVNALMSVFESLEGNLLNEPQLRVLCRMFALLLDKPFLTADEADAHFEELEAVGLNPYPAEFVEFLSDGEGVR